MAPDPVEQLAALVARMESTVHAVEAKLQADIDRNKHYWPDRQPPTPDEMMDMHGRYILLDARVTLLAAQIELTRATS